MSASSQRIRKSSPCSTSKQGPMRATLPVSSLLRQRAGQQLPGNGGGDGATSTNSSGSVIVVVPTAAAAVATSGTSTTGGNTNGTSWRTRISPESTASGQRSPGSVSCKGYFAKSKTLSARCSDNPNGSQSIRRTASLDTIYLKGQWPRDSHYVHHSSLLVDKATQVAIAKLLINFLNLLIFFFFFFSDRRLVQRAQKARS